MTSLDSDADSIPLDPGEGLLVVAAYAALAHRRALWTGGRRDA